MSKIVSRDTARIKRGIDAVADAVRVTIGPRGKNVVIANGLHPIIANDGGRISKEISLKDPIEDVGASLIKEVIQKTSDDVGGGRTASAIITQSAITEGLNLTQKGFNANALKRGMELAVQDIVKEIEQHSKPVKDKDLEHIATISTESEALGQEIAQVVNNLGKDSVVTVEQSNTFGLSTEYADGLRFDRGYISPYMATNERLEAEYEDIPVLIVDKKVSLFKEIQPTIEKLVQEGKKNLLIIAEDFEGEALNVCVLAKLQGRFNTLVIKTPGVGDMKKFCLEDLEALTEAKRVDEHDKDGKLGRAKKVISHKDHTVIQGTGDVHSWIITLQTRQALSENKWEKDQYQERIAKLSNGIAVIKVGASSETEVKYLKLKIEDGVNEAKRALESGIVVGGNAVFINALKNLKPRELSPDESLGYELVKRAAEAPLRQIVENGNSKPDIVIDTLLRSKSGTIGYNSLTDEVVADMFVAGIVDATKVAVTVLQNAISAAAMFLSVDTIIANEPEKDND
jgi:chaperonin GroEL